MASKSDLTSTNSAENKRSVSEVGHAKNIANLNLLNTHIIQLGAQYVPSNQTIRLTVLQALHDNALGQHMAVQNLTAPYALAVDARELVFSPVNKNLTGLRLAYKATDGVTTQHLDGLMTHIRKIKGERAPGAPKGDGSHSTSQASFDQRTSHMQPLIAYLHNTPNFSPNEAQYTVASYEDKKAQMLAATQAVHNAYVPLNAARTTRDDLMYHSPQNLVATAQKAKDYLLSILPKTSPQYKAVLAIKFRNIIA